MVPQGGLPDMSWASGVGLLTVAIWLYLLVARGGFWLARERDDRGSFPEPMRWPSVAAIVPARNEADVIGRSIKSLLSQDYAGTFRVVVVDDGSDDGTADAAMAAASDAGVRVEVRRGSALPAGWAGKVWA